MKKVLSTKMLDSNALAYAQSNQLAVQCIDFIETTAQPFNPESVAPESFDTVVFTSANGVKYFFENTRAASIIKNKRVLGLQGKTLDGLLAKGIMVSHTAQSAGELAGVIVSEKSAQAVLHVCGSLTLPVLQNILTQSGIAYTALVVYKTVASPQKVNDLFDAILFFSPSGVESFGTQNKFDSATVCCCIGATTAQALKAKTGNIPVILPHEPSPIAMLSVLADYFKNDGV